MRLFSVVSILLSAVAVSMVNPYPETIDISGGYTLDDVNFDLNQPVLLYGLDVNNHIIIEEKVKKNQFLSDILQSYNVPVTAA